MNLIECPTNHTERKTPPQSPSEDLGEANEPMHNAELLAKMASLGAGRRGKRGTQLTAGDILIPWLIERGAYYDGNVFVWPTGKKTKPYTNKLGYHKISKNLGSKKFVTFSVARFICWKAHGAPVGLYNVVDHINRKRNDDRPENLRWVTHKMNIHNVAPSAWVNRANNLLWVNLLSPEQRRAIIPTKLTKQDVLEMRLVYATGRFTANEIGLRYGIGSNALHILRGHGWKDVPMVPPVKGKPAKGEWPNELLQLWKESPGPQSWARIFQATNQ